MRDDKKPTPREILSKNVKALMAVKPELGTIKKVALASGSALSNGKVGRIVAASHTTDIDALQDLANVFKVQPWQLLVENLNPELLPRLVGAAELNQLLDAVVKSVAPDANFETTKAPAHQVQTGAGDNLSPALRRATNTRELGKREPSKSGGVQKPRTGRRS